MTQNILLDPDILVWVLLPLVGIMVFIGILRHYVTLLLQSPKTPQVGSTVNANAARYGHLLGQHGRYLSTSGMRQRVQRHRTGPLTKGTTANPMDMMGDPSMMGDMMKNNMMMMVPNMGMMMLVSYFFSGFVVAKFPFQLSARFRGMIQRGVDIDDLECSYVTSLSLYFLILFGLQGITDLIVGGTEGDETSTMMMPQMGQAPNQPVDYKKVFAQLSSELEFHEKHHTCILTAAPALLLSDM